jgi:hypothetical protein
LTPTSSTLHPHPQVSGATRPPTVLTQPCATRPPTVLSLLRHAPTHCLLLSLPPSHDPSSQSQPLLFPTPNTGRHTRCASRSEGASECVSCVMRDAMSGCVQVTRDRLRVVQRWWTQTTMCESLKEREREPSHHSPVGWLKLCATRPPTRRRRRRRYARASQHPFLLLLLLLLLPPTIGGSAFALRANPLSGPARR